jgi:ATP synthase F1 delta subunit
MSSNSRVGDPYAYAFLKILSEKGLSFAVFSGLTSDILDFSNILRLYPNFEEFLSNPIYEKKKKKEFLNNFFYNYLSPLLVNFLNLLCDTKRIININSILKLFLEILLKSTNSYVVELEVSNVKNCKFDINKLDKILSSWFLKTRKINTYKNINVFKKPIIIFKFKETPNLFGGLKLNFLTESKVIDFSIKGKIQNIAKGLKY